ncbi:MAG: cytochrome c maturation protein CcmE [Candidatus Sedimenticola endophacoides]|uniref:Cytochrome c-type biogenesis protein CcmE n=1 Tax=Candidatus Sedimenticola endophacoides TaxID=2548426 RepID=A0A6N4E5C6_9GAMM|nr:MAG: cytochrome c biogenesis protein CcmE [Candidatus Sedimenticola endophacoides]OQX37635.1 MAG: cytochrome c biogenesis protein CcmE [Candidatus Sedimenticola endophacoides]OQX42090.1 MAG: cytochrome c biogenesis protein CcmE [Candidatus Sedimenticola endophacoides]OQX43365.1 MAG: cytochrome c biogenesis protein CcmE [Candidatus Sedimenticola endophacoides]OQX46303.1 MAG: cytochrome c biogenesis protein CcmE [Candidatus Sedimenticola endophacoides]
MKARHKRFGFIAAGLVGLGLAAWLVLNALDNNLSYFFSPTEVVENKAPADHVFRLGGLVEGGSLQRGQELTIRFVVSDGANRVNVAYTGILPDLFAEGQGVIAQGRMGEDGVFIADEVLAKHDENYMPPEVAEALDKAHNQATEATN